MATTGEGREWQSFRRPSLGVRYLYPGKDERMLKNPFQRHAKTKYIQVNTRLCQACWTCIPACPNHVLGKIDLTMHHHVRVDSADDCKGCKACVRACPHGAILYTYTPQKNQVDRECLERK